MQENYETLISLAEEMAISLPRITALAEPHRRGLVSGFPLSKSDLFSWMDREDSWIPELQRCEERTMPSQINLGSDNQEVLNEIAQQSQLHLLPSLYSRASPVKATPDKQPSSCQWYPESMHDAVLKSQEALRMVLTNQDTLKNLVNQLQNTMSSIEDRVQAIEQQMSIFAQFNKEIDQLGDETNFNEIAFYP